MILTLAKIQPATECPVRAPSNASTPPKLHVVHINKRALIPSSAHAMNSILAGFIPPLPPESILFLHLQKLGAALPNPHHPSAMPSNLYRVLQSAMY
jgi:hypothetical protein